MKSIFGNLFVRLLGIVILLFLLVTFVTLQLKENDLLAEQHRLEVEIEQMNEYINELEAEIGRPFDEEYVAEIAHEKLGLRYPQEIVFYSSDDN
ncbi:MAG: septum formation initiator family protein [Clostridia bacterium]|nr:septum formation initiator family protein [Clostridia bacterium]